MSFSFQAWRTFPASPVPPGPVPPGIPGPTGPPGPPGSPGLPGAGLISRRIEIDFGSTPVEEKIFTVVDPEITPASRIVGSVVYAPPTGKDLDETEVDSLALQFGVGSGQFDIFARALIGSVSGKFVVNYFLNEP